MSNKPVKTVCVSKSIDKLKFCESTGTTMYGGKEEGYIDYPHIA